MLLDDIPGLSRAVARAKGIEDRWRELAFLPVGEEICGVPVRQLTLRHLRILLSIHSPFLHGKTPTLFDIERFLWVVSPRFNIRGLGKVDFARSIEHLSYARVCRAINRYIDRALLDRPATTGSGTPIAVSFDAYLVDRIARTYGWSDEQILDAPLARLYQYLRLIQLKDNPRTPQISRLSDRVRQRKINAQLAKMSHVNGASGAAATCTVKPARVAGEEAGADE